MSRLIDLGDGDVWEGSIFFDILDFWKSNVPSQSHLAHKLSFAFDSGIKYCDLSNESIEVLRDLQKLLIRYRQEIEMPSQIRILANAVPRVVGEVNELIKMMDKRISHLESKKISSRDNG